ncbi:hypothetical protein [Conyzicola sp.]|uniref:hypothetical protein n=1 Tax=Conyzicola sp. TaxID=1969404 RepID=UPI003989EB4D
MTLPAESPLIYIGDWIWDGTFAAAIVTGFIALIAAVFSAITWLASHKQIAKLASRNDWLTRYQLAVQQMSHKSNFVAAAGLTLMTGLVSAKWASDEDKAMAVEVLARFEDN